ncbi:hypothetical protein DZ860_21155 [Vibrio sinensis]|uniref:Uncharacterized protein n=1 Tax=Vibrio sinensis TaxID=2302434 RepID=A0A3A6QHI8_9VIBR|nr:hypothetical protein [Vibrio sinensis]RJX65870.1 hypothetical protein DZ860_21155 [Vibrio sinensis]
MYLPLLFEIASLIASFCLLFITLIIATKCVFPITPKHRLHRWSFTVGFSLAIGFQLSVIGINGWLLMLVMASCGLMAFGMLFRLQDSHTALLVVVPSALNPTQAHIHLRNPTDTFTKQTYHELPQLLTILSQQGFKTAVLTSPMFVKETGTRPIHRLTRILAKTIDNIDIQSSSCWKHPLGTASLLFAKYLQKTTTLKNTSIIHWPQITLSLKLAREGEVVNLRF